MTVSEDSVLIEEEPEATPGELLLRAHSHGIASGALVQALSSDTKELASAASTSNLSKKGYASALHSLEEDLDDCTVKRNPIWESHSREGKTRSLNSRSPATASGPGKNHVAQLEREMGFDLTEGAGVTTVVPEPRHVAYATVMAESLRRGTHRTASRESHRKGAKPPMSEGDRRELTRAQREVVWNLQKEHVITIVGPEDEPVPYKRQGNPAVNTPQSVRRRHALRKGPLIEEISNEYWCFPGLKPEHSDEMTKESYVKLNRKLHLALIPGTTDDEALQSAEVDWARDTARWGGRMSREAFMSSMFELADIWTENIGEEEYTAFLWLLLETITNSNVVPPSFKPDREIECIVDKNFLQLDGQARDSLSALGKGDGASRGTPLPLDVEAIAHLLAKNHGKEAQLSPQLKDKHVHRLRALRERLHALKELRAPLVGHQGAVNVKDGADHPDGPTATEEHSSRRHRDRRSASPGDGRMRGLSSTSPRDEAARLNNRAGAVAGGTAVHDAVDQKTRRGRTSEGDSSGKEYPADMSLVDSQSEPQEEGASAVTESCDAQHKHREAPSRDVLVGLLTRRQEYVRASRDEQANEKWGCDRNTRDAHGCDQAGGASPSVLHMDEAASTLASHHADRLDTSHEEQSGDGSLSSQTSREPFHEVRDAPSQHRVEEYLDGAARNDVVASRPGTAVPLASRHVREDALGNDNCANVPSVDSDEEARRVGPSDDATGGGGGETKHENARNDHSDRSKWYTSPAGASPPPREPGRGQRLRSVHERDSTSRRDSDTASTSSDALAAAESASGRQLGGDGRGKNDWMHTSDRKRTDIHGTGQAPSASDDGRERKGRVEAGRNEPRATDMSNLDAAHDRRQPGLVIDAEDDTASRTSVGSPVAHGQAKDDQHQGHLLREGLLSPEAERNEYLNAQSARETVGGKAMFVGAADTSALGDANAAGHTRGPLGARWSHESKTSPRNACDTGVQDQTSALVKDVGVEQTSADDHERWELSDSSHFDGEIRRDTLQSSTATKGNTAQPDRDDSRQESRNSWKRVADAKGESRGMLSPPIERANATSAVMFESGKHALTFSLTARDIGEATESTEAAVRDSAEATCAEVSPSDEKGTTTMVSLTTHGDRRAHVGQTATRSRQADTSTAVKSIKGAQEGLEGALHGGDRRKMTPAKGERRKAGRDELPSTRGFSMIDERRADPAAEPLLPSRRNLRGSRGAQSEEQVCLPSPPRSQGTQRTASVFRTGGGGAGWDGISRTTDEQWEQMIQRAKDEKRRRTSKSYSSRNAPPGKAVQRSKAGTELISPRLHTRAGDRDTDGDYRQRHSRQLPIPQRVPSLDLASATVRRKQTAADEVQAASRNSGDEDCAVLASPPGDEQLRAAENHDDGKGKDSDVVRNGSAITGGELAVHKLTTAAHGIVGPKQVVTSARAPVSEAEASFVPLDSRWCSAEGLARLQGVLERHRMSLGDVFTGRSPSRDPRSMAFAGHPDHSGLGLVNDKGTPQPCAPSSGGGLSAVDGCTAALGDGGARDCALDGAGVGDRPPCNHLHANRDTVHCTLPDGNVRGDEAEKGTSDDQTDEVQGHVSFIRHLISPPAPGESPEVSTYGRGHGLRECAPVVLKGGRGHEAQRILPNTAQSPYAVDDAVVHMRPLQATRASFDAKRPVLDLVDGRLDPWPSTARGAAASTNPGRGDDAQHCVQSDATDAQLLRSSKAHPEKASSMEHDIPEYARAPSLHAVQAGTINDNGRKAGGYRREARGGTSNRGRGQPPELVSAVADSLAVSGQPVLADIDCAYRGRHSSILPAIRDEPRLLPPHGVEHETGTQEEYHTQAPKVSAHVPNAHHAQVPVECACPPERSHSSMHDSVVARSHAEGREGVKTREHLRPSNDNSDRSGTHGQTRERSCINAERPISARNFPSRASPSRRCSPSASVSGVPANKENASAGGAVHLDGTPVAIGQGGYAASNEADIRRTGTSSDASARAPSTDGNANGPPPFCPANVDSSVSAQPVQRARVPSGAEGLDASAHTARGTTDDGTVADCRDTCALAATDRCGGTHPHAQRGALYFVRPSPNEEAISTSHVAADPRQHCAVLPPSVVQDVREGTEPSFDFDSHPQVGGSTSSRGYAPSPHHTLHSRHQAPAEHVAPQTSHGATRSRSKSEIMEHDWAGGTPRDGVNVFAVSGRRISGEGRSGIAAASSTRQIGRRISAVGRKSQVVNQAGDAEIIVRRSSSQGVWRLDTTAMDIVNANSGGAPATTLNAQGSSIRQEAKATADPCPSAYDVEAREATTVSRSCHVPDDPQTAKPATLTVPLDTTSDRGFLGAVSSGHARENAGREEQKESSGYSARHSSAGGKRTRDSQEIISRHGERTSSYNALRNMGSGVTGGDAQSVVPLLLDENLGGNWSEMASDTAAGSRTKVPRHVTPTYRSTRQVEPRTPDADRGTSAHHRWTAGAKGKHDAAKKRMRGEGNGGDTRRVATNWQEGIAGASESHGGSRNLPAVVGPGGKIVRCPRPREQGSTSGRATQAIDGDANIERVAQDVAEQIERRDGTRFAEALAEVRKALIGVDDSGANQLSRQADARLRQANANQDKAAGASTRQMHEDIDPTEKAARDAFSKSAPPRPLNPRERSEEALPEAPPMSERGRVTREGASTPHASLKFEEQPKRTRRVECRTPFESSGQHFPDHQKSPRRRGRALTRLPLGGVGALPDASVVQFTNDAASGDDCPRHGNGAAHDFYCEEHESTDVVDRPHDDGVRELGQGGVLRDFFERSGTSLTGNRRSARTAGCLDPCEVEERDALPHGRAMVGTSPRPQTTRSFAGASEQRTHHKPNTSPEGQCSEVLGDESHQDSKSTPRSTSDRLSKVNSGARYYLPPPRRGLRHHADAPPIDDAGESDGSGSRRDLRHALERRTRVVKQSRVSHGSRREDNDRSVGASTADGRTKFGPSSTRRRRSYESSTTHNGQLHDLLPSTRPTDFKHDGQRLQRTSSDAPAETDDLPYFVERDQVRKSYSGVGLPPWRTPAPGEPAWDPIMNYCEVKQDEEEAIEERKRRDYLCRRRSRHRRDGSIASGGESSTGDFTAATPRSHASSVRGRPTPRAVPTTESDARWHDPCEDGGDSDADVMGNRSSSTNALARRVNQSSKRNAVAFTAKHLKPEFRSQDDVTLVLKSSTSPGSTLPSALVKVSERSTSPRVGAAEIDLEGTVSTRAVGDNAGPMMAKVYTTSPEATRPRQGGDMAFSWSSNPLPGASDAASRRTSQASCALEHIADDMDDLHKLPSAPHYQHRYLSRGPMGRNGAPDSVYERQGVVHRWSRTSPHENVLHPDQRQNGRSPDDLRHHRSAASGTSLTPIPAAGVSVGLNERPRTSMSGSKWSQDIRLQQHAQGRARLAPATRTAGGRWGTSHGRLEALVPSEESIGVHMASAAGEEHGPWILDADTCSPNVQSVSPRRDPQF